MHFQAIKIIFFRYFSPFIGFLILLIPSVTFALQEPRGWGETALGFMGPVDLLSDFMVNACLVIGFTFLFATFIKYRQYKINPLHVPLSTVIFLLICSLMLLSFPLIPLLLNYLENAGS